MQRKTLFTLGIAGIVSGLALAQMPPGKFWRDPHAQKELAISQDQISQLNQIHERTRDQLIDLRAEVEKKVQAVEDAFDKEPFDEGQARTAQAARDQAVAEVFKAEAVKQIALRKVLTLEQWMKLEAFRPPMPPGPPGGPGPGMGPGMGGRGPMGPGGPGGPGPDGPGRDESGGPPPRPTE